MVVPVPAGMSPIATIAAIVRQKEMEVSDGPGAHKVAAGEDRDGGEVAMAVGLYMA